jgi:hypothetical protein
MPDFMNHPQCRHDARFEHDASAPTSILDVSGRLSPSLLGVTLILPALRVALLIGGAAILLVVSRALTSILTNITPGAALLRLLRRPGHSGRSH